jgi:hypothetical protein
MCSVGSNVSQLPSRLVFVCPQLWFTPTSQVVFISGFQLCLIAVAVDFCGSASKFGFFPVFFSKYPAESLPGFPNQGFCVL